MKIYTKKGDEGKTSLIGGDKVPKYHERIDAYGTIDELNSFTGLARDLIKDEHLRNVLEIIQNLLFDIGSNLASSEKSKMKLPQVEEEDIRLLENEMDEMEEGLEPLKNFILPGGHPAVSQCHICRTICRRAERKVVELNDHIPVNPLILKYLNRLSDYYFMLARKVAALEGVQEVLWSSKKNK